MLLGFNDVADAKRKGRKKGPLRIETFAAQKTQLLAIDRKRKILENVQKLGAFLDICRNAFFLPQRCSYFFSLDIIGFCYRQSQTQPDGYYPDQHTAHENFDVPHRRNTMGHIIMFCMGHT